jgi:hypothetical protein
MQISNVRRIIVEDYPQDSRATVEKLAVVLNSFMDEVVTLSRGNISYDNLNKSIVIVDLQVDENGKPKGVSQINTQLQTHTGAKIVNVQSLSGGDNVISAPYLDCTYQGNGLVKVNKFHGLPPNKKIRITIEFIG